MGQKGAHTMDNNVISLSDFRDRKNQQTELLQSASSFGDALAIEEQISPEEYMHEMATEVKEKIFKTIPQYRFLIEDGVWDNLDNHEDDEYEPHTVRVRMKGTDIAGYGRNIGTAWMTLSINLINQGLL